MQTDLFATDTVALGQHSQLLRAALLPHVSDIMQDISNILTQAPLRHFSVPSGKQMSVASSNCGSVGWVSDHRGYRYQTHDPLTDKPWPAIPARWQQLASHFAAQACYANYTPDCCLINCYQHTAKMGLHADKDERDFSQPIVSFSLGASAEFLWGGLQRSQRTEKILLQHGDVLVWGGADRLRLHGINKIMINPSFPNRYNLTFRRAL